MKILKKRFDIIIYKILDKNVFQFLNYNNIFYKIYRFNVIPN